jgi:Molybdopterin cofactor-binding domain
LAAARLGRPAADLALRNGEVVADGEPRLALAALLAAEVVEETREYHHRQTQALDPETGQADAHVAFAFAAHRAVVDVDTELGLVKVVEIATAQDVGKAINPQAVEGQIEGGIAQGLGLAVMEEIQVADGKVRNPSFTDYLIPTVLDMPPVRLDVLELGHPHSPYGLRGVGEPPTISSTPAIVAAIRAATGRPLTRVPVRPEHIVGVPGAGSEAGGVGEEVGRAGTPEVADVGRDRVADDPAIAPPAADPADADPGQTADDPANAPLNPDSAGAAPVPGPAGADPGRASVDLDLGPANAPPAPDPANAPPDRDGG